MNQNSNSWRSIIQTVPTSTSYCDRDPSISHFHHLPEQKEVQDICVFLLPIIEDRQALVDIIGSFLFKKTPYIYSETRTNLQTGKTASMSSARWRRCLNRKTPQAKHPMLCFYSPYLLWQFVLLPSTKRQTENTKNHDVDWLTTFATF
jgi:hypothetical protein